MSLQWVGTNTISLKIDYDVQSNEESSQSIFLKKILKYYQENDIQQGDPNEGKWEEAHYPLPKHLGGQTVVLLLREHHQLQGVYQSEEFGVKCFWNGHPSKALDRHFYPNWFEIYDLYDKWLSIGNSEAGVTSGEIRKERGDSFNFQIPEVMDKAVTSSLESRRKSGSWGFEDHRDRGNQTQREKGIGFHDPEFQSQVHQGQRERESAIYSPETRRKSQKALNEVKWECLQTGHVSNTGGLTIYQVNRKIDTSLRRRIN